MNQLQCRRLLPAALIAAITVLNVPAFAQSERGAAGSSASRGVREFKPPPVPQPPEPVLIPPPEHLAPPGRLTNMAPSLSEQSQSLLGRTSEALPPPPASTVIRAIIGFVTLLVLAYLGGTRRVQALERQWNIAHLMTTGLPFLLLGLLAALPDVRILTPSVLREVAPLLPLGLGWIGFVVGLRFDARSLERTPGGTGDSVLFMTAIPAGLMFAGLAVTMSFVSGRGADADLLRDALLLATAGTMSARSSPSFLRTLLPSQYVSQRLVRIIELEQLAGVFGLMMISAYYRPSASLVAWQLPGTAWLFITVGIGTTMGVMLYVCLTKIRKDPQFTAVLLGFVAFAAGMASYLRLSPVTVCFIAGAITINVGREWHQQVTQVFERLERPVYFVFMVIAGALWHPWEWQGWALMLAFITLRIVAKWVSARALGAWLVRDLTPDERRALIIAPMGALSVAIVVAAQDLYSAPTVAWIVTAVIGGSLISEVALQMVRRRAARRCVPAHAPACDPAAVSPEVD